MDLNNCSNSSESVGELLRQLGEKSNTTMIPAVVMLVLFAVVGLVGNILVLVVYSQKVRLNPTKVLIMTIASFDLVANVGAIPSEINNMMDAWTFSHAWICKLKVFLASLTTLGGAISLCVVAVVRYRKVCKPYRWQVTIKQAKISSLVVGLLALICSIPYPIIYGIRTKATPCPNINGSECFHSDQYFPTIWPLMNNILFIVLFISFSSSFIVLYVLLAKTAWNHRDHRSVSQNISKGKGKHSTSRSQGGDSKREESQDELPQNHPGSFNQTLGQTRPATHGKIHFLLCCSLRRKSLENEQDSQSSIIMKANSSHGSSDNEDLCSTGTRSDQLSSEATSIEATSSAEVTSSKATNSAETTSSKATNSAEVTSSKEVTFSEDASPKDISVVASTKLHWPLDLRNPQWKSPLFPTEHINTMAVKHGNKQVTQEAETAGLEKHNIQQDGQETLTKIDYCIENCSNENKLPSPVNFTKKKNIRTKTALANKQCKSGVKDPRRKSLGKLTTMLIIISVIYVFSYLPYLILTIIRSKLPEKYASLDQLELIFANLFHRMYFLNSAANPIVYSFCDVNFRRKCIELMTCKYKRFL